MVARPNLTFTVTPPGGSATDYTSYLAYTGANQQMTITQSFGRQGDTALFPLVDEYATTPHFHIEPMSQVKLVDNNIGKTLFAGVVTAPAQCVEGTNLNEWDLSCTDYTLYADNAIVRGIFYGQTADEILISLTAQANCGISAAATSAGGYVAPAPVLASYILNFNTLSYAWRQLATLAAQSTPYGWYVDENRALHFIDQTTAISSGVTFTTSPTVAGSATEGHIALDTQNAYAWDGTTIRNRVMVQGATQTITYGSYTTSPATDTWLADGVTQSWPLRYTVTGSPVLQAGGVLVSVTVVANGGTASGAWVVEQNNSGGWFLHASAAPAAGTTIRIWYDYQVPIVAQASDAASQAAYTGPNGGVFTEFISDSSLTSMPMALSRAQRERTEYAFAAERFTFNTTEEWTGWVRAGETCAINNRFAWDTQSSSWGVNGTFIVTANRVTFGRGGYRTCQVTAVRL